MIDFHARRLVLTRAAVAIGIGLVSSGAHAQAPLSLLPPAVTEANAAETPGDIEFGSEEAFGQGIVVSPLAAPDLQAIGFLDSANGGFGERMWRGTSRAVIERLLPQLPTEIASHVLRDLARRLLLSAAPLPGGGVPLGAATEGADLLALRIEKLASMGEFAGLNRLLGLIPQRHDSESVSRRRVEALLLDGQLEDACGLANNKVSQDYGDGYWHLARIVCLTLTGQIDRARLAIDVLREQDADRDSAFLLLADALNGVPLGAEVVPTPSPLHLAMVRGLDQPLPETALGAASPDLLAAVAVSANPDLAQRTYATERSVEAGLLPADVLAIVYQAYDFEEADLNNAVSHSAALPGPTARALLYQAAQRGESAAVRAELLRRALDRAKEDQLYSAVLRVLLPLLIEIPARPDMIWFAETAGRAHYAAGRFEQASAWMTLARQEAVINPAASTAVTALWPYAQLAGNSGLAWGGDLDTWRSLQADATQASRQTIILRVCFQALGIADPLPWNELTDPDRAGDPTWPDPALLYALDDAGREARLGETVLLALLAFDDVALDTVHPMAVSMVLQSLARVGFEHEARRLAIEIAFAHGI